MLDKGTNINFHIKNIKGLYKFLKHDLSFFGEKIRKVKLYKPKLINV